MAGLIGLDSTGSGFDPGLQDPPITFGVWGDSGEADGVIGSSNTGVGVFGRSVGAGAPAVRAASENGTGVQATSASGTALHARRDPGGGATVTEAFLATPSLAADFRGDVAATGALRVGGRLGIGAAEPRRSLHVEGSEVHSGGPGGGFSFADRAGTSLVEDPQNGERWRWYAEGGSARLWSGTDRLTIDKTGNIGIGVAAGQAKRPLHVEGSEIHSGGPGGGFSFADRTTAGGSFAEDGAGGQRWRWYADQGVARLWSAGADHLSVHLRPAPHEAGLEVHRRMRVLQGSAQNHSAGIWFAQDQAGDRGFVGMASNDAIGFWGNTGAGWGVFMNTTSGELSAKAARFEGDVFVHGTLTKTRNQFQIDHPLDPGNRYLNHCSIESDEMKNIYDGAADLDDDGRAEVLLPEWFEALNENFRYQLTPIGAAAPDLHIAAELHDGRFTIAGGQPNTKVCWQVSGVRHDAYATAHPMQVEVDKSAEEAGLFLHPEEHDQPAERSLAAQFAMAGNGAGQH